MLGWRGHKRQVTAGAGEDVETEALLLCWKDGKVTWGKSDRPAAKLPHDPVIPLPGLNPKEVKTFDLQKDLGVCTAALFIIIKKEKTISTCTD